MYIHKVQSADSKTIVKILPWFAAMVFDGLFVCCFFFAFFFTIGVINLLKEHFELYNVIYM